MVSAAVSAEFVFARLVPAVKSVGHRFIPDIIGQHAPSPPLPHSDRPPRFIANTAAATATTPIRMISVRRFMLHLSHFPLHSPCAAGRYAPSLALAELAGFGDLVRRKLHLVREGLGDGDLAAGHRRSHLQPFLQIGLTDEEGLLETSR